MRRPKLRRGLLLAGYVLCWMAICAGVLGLIISVLWEIAALSQLTGIDDDVSLAAFPLGALAGIGTAMLTRRQRWVHLSAITAGLMIAAGVHHSLERLCQTAVDGVRRLIALDQGESA